MRDEKLLESAVYRPQASFGGQDLYPDLFTKAAALGHFLVSNHPFMDGNKRVGFEAMRLMLRVNGWDLHSSVESKYGLVMKIAEGKLTQEQIAGWLREHSKEK